MIEYCFDSNKSKILKSSINLVILHRYAILYQNLIEQKTFINSNDK